MKLTIISGGQTGADQAALRAAKSRGFPTGGVAPKGWKTEAGPAPWLAEYGLTELDTADYKVRTSICVSMCDAVLWFGNQNSPGGRCTIREAHRQGRPIMTGGVHCGPEYVAAWAAGYIGLHRERVTLMVAGNRESKNPGIGERVEAFVGEVLDLL